MTVGSADGYRRGIRHFNAREFYDAHEVWEDVWRESQGMEKRFLQGLIQAAVALHHHSTGNVEWCAISERVPLLGASQAKEVMFGARRRGGTNAINLHNAYIVSRRSGKLFCRKV